METIILLILCLLAGTVCLIVEVFMPGFGIPGLSGILLLVVGVALTGSAYGSLAAIITALIAAVLAGISIAFSLKSASSGKLSRSSLFLKNDETSGGALTFEELNGRKGETLTVLNPVGFAQIDGNKVQVITEGSYLEKGVMVTVIRQEGNKIIVRPNEA